MSVITYWSIYVFSFFSCNIDANKTGVAQETLNNIRRASRAMTEQEARQILGVTEQSSWDEIVQVLKGFFHKKNY